MAKEEQSGGYSTVATTNLVTLLAKPELEARLQRIEERWRDPSWTWDALFVYTGELAEGEPAGYRKSYALMMYLLGVEAQQTAVLLRGTGEGALIWLGTADRGVWDALVATASVFGLASEEAAQFQQVEMDGVDASTETSYRPKVTRLRGTLRGKWTFIGEWLRPSSGLADALAAAEVPDRSLLILGALVKERHVHQGDFADQCGVYVFGNEGTSPTKLPVNSAEWIGNLLITKLPDEVQYIRKAAYLCAKVCHAYFVERMESILDEDTPVSHDRLSQEVEARLVAPATVGVQLVAHECEAAYPPIIQSGRQGPFDLRPSASSNDQNLSTGLVIASIGARYHQYCANVVRTYLVDMEKSIREQYTRLLQALEAVRKALRPNEPAHNAYQAAVQVLGTELASAHLAGKQVGFGIGLEFRDATWLLNEHNHKILQMGMTFQIQIGLERLGENQHLALAVADTVLVGGTDPEGAEVLTQAAPKAPAKVTYFLEMDGDEELDEREEAGVTNHGDASAVDAATQRGGNASTVTTRRRTQQTHAPDEEDTTAEAERIRAHQQKLAQQKLLESRARILGKSAGASEGDQGPDGKGFRALNAYRAYERVEEFPAGLRPRQLFVDMDREVLLTPITGIPVPFHIATVKNASKSDESGFTYLRINFLVPGTSTSAALPASGASGMTAPAGVTGAAARLSLFPDNPGFVLKELSFRSASAANLNEVFRKIKELRKRFTSRETEAQEKETLVKQAPLILETDPRRIPHLVDVSIRPALGAGGQRANQGILEAHGNGFRFRSRQQRTVDILYSNVKHAFFQEARNEVIVLLHFHLRTPIMVGKRKTLDVQFYTEVMDATVRLADTRRNPFDVDEIEEEQRERENRHRMNKLFFKFTKEVEAKADEQIEFDMPYRELGFEGAPDKMQRFLMPTRDCLVDLIEFPPVVVSLEEIEVAHFERVTYSLKNFDLVLVMKNFAQDPVRGETQWIRISSVPTTELDAVKKWLDSVNIPFYQGPWNLNWNTVLSTIRDDLEGFYEGGGWRFLDTEASSSEEEGEDDDAAATEADGSRKATDGEANAPLSDQDDEYVPSDEELEAETSDSDYENDDDDDSFAESEEEIDLAQELGDDDAGEAELSSSDEGMDWDELERQTREEERRKRKRWQDDEADEEEDEEENREAHRHQRGKQRTRGPAAMHHAQRTLR
jgi:nucleosome binding factor SPN SPT16 subunit